MEYFDYWYLFPIGIVIATIYSSTGISGANFWIPTYILLVKIDPLTGFWLSLVTVLFGSISGIVAHQRFKSINYKIVNKYLVVTIPSAILGALLINYIAINWLLILFGSVVILYAFYFLSLKNPKGKPGQTKVLNFILSTIGGFLVGLISVGLGKLILPGLFRDDKVNHHSEAIGTALFIVFITSISVVLARLNNDFISSLNDNYHQLLSISIIVIPGVIIGGQIGPYISRFINTRNLKIYVSITLITIGILVFYRALNPDIT